MSYGAGLKTGGIAGLFADAYLHPYWWWLPLAHLAMIPLGLLFRAVGRHMIAAAERHREVTEENCRKLRSLIRQEWRNN